MKTDSELQQSVLQELKWESRVQETEVGVEVNRGVVTLSGTVDSWGKRAAAEAAAHRVKGVLDVANDITVKLAGTPGRTDTELAHAVRHALEWDVFVPENQIRTTVSDGWVTLEGEVDCGSQRRDAERAIRNLAGVKVLINHLEVKPRAFEGDIRSSIQAAMKRQAVRAADQIRIEVESGRVSLSGEVDSWPEKQAVLRAVRDTQGVRTVEDHLRVTPASL